MAALTQTIAIVDKSNKVVGHTKQLKNVFKEAKMAYLERRAEIVAERKKKEDRELEKARSYVRAMTIAEDESTTSSRRTERRHKSRRHAHYESDEDEDDRDKHRRPSHRNHRHHSPTSVQSGRSIGSRSSFDSGHRSTRSASQSPRDRHVSLGQFNDDLVANRSAPPSPTGNELVRRRTDGLVLQEKNRRPSAARAHSTTDIDMDLAYGEYHPSSIGLALDPKTEEKLQQQELKTLVNRAKELLDEANCAQHSVKAIIAHLQKNPDAMASVGLTLAEISAVVTKVAPGALASIKASAPAVFALLASPQFLIAVGVGVGVTVVAIGGYKIIKKIQSSREKEGSVEELLEVKELDRIDHWRRGIADAGDEAYEASIISGTSVEGEFITPMAARSMGHFPETKEQKKERRKNEKKQAKEDKKGKKDKKSSTSKSEVGSESSKASSKLKTRVEDVRGKELVKKPSPLRRMFTHKDGSSTAS